MPSKHLTDLYVKNARPQAGKQVTYIDTLRRGCALVLVVSYGGTKTFRLMTYVNGKPRTRKLGTYPTMTLKQARDMALAYFENPNRAEVGSFKSVAENWLHRHVYASGMRSARERRRHLHTYVYPKWEARPFLEIRRSDVNALLDHIADHHGGTQADAVLATLRSIMFWHQARDENYISPIVRGMQRNKRKARSRILDDAELRALWEATEGKGAFNALIRTLLLTAQRREKVATMKWDDLSDGYWNIRVEEREKGTAGKIKLPPLVRQIIQAQPRVLNNPYVFTGRGRAAFNSFSPCKFALDRKLPPKMPPWRVHDLRRSARSLMSRAGVLNEHAELVLGHAIPGVAGVYDRFSYEPQKAQALQRLSKLVLSIVR
jgi:integrase